MTNRCLIILSALLFMSMLCPQISSAISPSPQKKAATTPSQPTKRMDLTQAINKIRPTIVKVVLEGWDAQGNLTTSSGTGFFINDEGTVITAAHVVNLPPGFTIRTHLSVRWPISPTVYGNVKITRGFAGEEAHLAGTDPIHDLAALTLLKSPVLLHGYPDGDPFDSPLKTCALLETTMIPDGSEVFTSGFPAFSAHTESAALFTTLGYVASSQPTEFEDGGETLKDVYFLDMRVNHGNSGGPTFSLRTASVVGVVDAYFAAPTEIQGQATDNVQQNSGIAVVVPSEYVEKLLDKLHLSKKCTQTSHRSGK